MKLHRRQFLETAALGTAGLLVTQRPLHAQPAPASADPTAPVALGKRLKVSRIGMGTGVQGGGRSSKQIRMGIDKFERVIAKAYDEGLRYFDMADTYGSHPIVGRVLKDKPRDGYTLISKVWLLPFGLPDKQLDDADVAVKRFLKEYGTDYLDLVQLHCMIDADWPRQMRKQMDLLEGLREKGLILRPWRHLPFASRLGSGGQGALGGRCSRPHQSRGRVHGRPAGSSCAAC